MTSEPHPLRCETCEKYSNKQHPIYPKDMHFCGEERISEHQPRCTSDKGCASHSSFQSEREKVLDDTTLKYKCLMRGECHQFVQEGVTKSCIGCGSLIPKELRQQGRTYD